MDWTYLEVLMLGQYQFTENMMQLYRCIQDDLSRDIFWARLRYDIEEPLGNENQMWMLDILSGAYAKEDLEQMQNWESRFIGGAIKNHSVWNWGLLSTNSDSYTTQWRRLLGILR